MNDHEDFQERLYPSAPTPALQDQLYINEIISIDYVNDFDELDQNGQD